MSWSGDGTALRAISSKRRVAPTGIGVVTYWSHSTPPALSTDSPTTLSLKLGAVFSPACSIFPQTWSVAAPHASASYCVHGGEVEPPPVTSAKPPELPVSAFVPPMKRGGPSV